MKENCMTNYRASITNHIFIVTAAFGTFHGCYKQDLKGPHRYRKSQNYHTRPIHPITGTRFLILDLKWEDNGRRIAK